MQPGEVTRMTLRNAFEFSVDDRQNHFVIQSVISADGSKVIVLAEDRGFCNSIVLSSEMLTG